MLQENRQKPLQFANCCKLLWMVRISTSQIFVSKICRRSLEVAASLNCLKQVHGTIFEGNTLDTSVTSNRLILPVWIWMFTHLKLKPNAEKQHKSKFASSRHSVVQDNSLILWFSSKVQGSPIWGDLAKTAWIQDLRFSWARGSHDFVAVQNSSKRINVLPSKDMSSTVPSSSDPCILVPVVRQLNSEVKRLQQTFEGQRVM